MGFTFVLIAHIFDGTVNVSRKKGEMKTLLYPTDNLTLFSIHLCFLLVISMFSFDLFQYVYDPCRVNI